MGEDEAMRQAESLNQQLKKVLETVETTQTREASESLERARGDGKRR